MLAGSARAPARFALVGATRVLLAIPSLLAVAVLVAGLGRSTVVLFAAATITLVPTLVPIIETQTRTLIAQPRVEAAMLAGAGRTAILRRELVPNLVPIIAADGAIRLLAAVLVIATVGFLALGVLPPAPDWGR